MSYVPSLLESNAILCRPSGDHAGLPVRSHMVRHAPVGYLCRLSPSSSHKFPISDSTWKHKPSAVRPAKTLDQTHPLNCLLSSGDSFLLYPSCRCHNSNPGWRSVPHPETMRDASRSRLVCEASRISAIRIH